MRRRANWMETVDVRILELLAERDEPVDVASMADDLGYLSPYVQRRVERLAAEGLVQPVRTDGYVLRDLGREFLDGELPPHFLDSLDE